MLAQTVENEKPPSIWDNPAGILWLVGIVLISFVLMRLAYRRVARSRQKSQRSIQERLDDQRKSHVMYDQLNQLMAALADMSRQINGQIDTRCARLEILIRQADDKIKQLSSLSYDNAPQKNNTDSNSNLTSSESIHEITEKYRHANETTNSEDQTAVISPDTHTGNSTPVTPQQLGPEAQQVLEMIEKGYSKIAIAQELDRPIGEIELILSLVGKKNR
ncbi:MAG: hypothetical protein JW860_02815 [Sedimentisphaerales bacterium]|nr:hypothetical protein [Sedimentisphaerales bacterium]